MRRAPLAAAALLLAAAAYADDPAPTTAATPSSQAQPKFKTFYIGEGGGYKGSDKATDDYLVGNQAAASNSGTPAAGTPGAPIPAAAAPGPGIPAAAAPGPGVAAVAAPKSSPSAASSPASPRIDAPSRSFAARPAAQGRNASIPADARPAGQSLWNGLVQPLEMNGAQAGAAADPDAARAQGERDYETHILGMSGGPARPELGGPAPASAGRPASTTLAAARADGGKVFVSLTLDPREAGSLRDAVAGLGAASGFKADARFEAMPGPDGTVRYSGWIPAGRLGDAMARPGVKSLRVENRPEPSETSETRGEFLVGLRVDDAARARDGVDAGVGALASAAEFRLTRVVGLETAPDGRTVAVVAGFLPLSRLSRAMALSEVVKIMPVGGEVPPPARQTPAEGGGLKGFAKFAVERGPWLIILTLLLLLPSLRAPARRVAAIFSPYR